ncbi:MMPL family transporter [Streptomyces sp. H62]
MCEQTPDPDRSHIPSPLSALARWAVRRDRVLLAAAALFTLLAGCLSLGVTAHLSAGSWLAEHTPSDRARTMLDRSPHGGMPPLLLLARTVGSVDDPSARTAGIQLVKDLRYQPGITAVDSYWTGPVGPHTNVSPHAPPDPLLRSSDGRTAAIALWLDPDQSTRHQATEHVLTQVAGRHGPLETRAAGEAAVTRVLQAHSERDLLRMELLALPATLVLLILVFGSVPAALLPLAVGIVAITGTIVILRAIAAFAPVSTFALSLTTAVGLALAVDYSLFILARYREEIETGLSHHEALIRATRTAGRTVTVSAGVVAASLLGLIALPLPLMRSLAFAGISVVLLAAAASLLIVPAALSCFGERMARRDILASRRRAARSKARWHNLAVVVMRRPLTVLALTSALLLLLALPFRDLTFGLSDERALPATTPVVKTMQDVRTEFPQMGTEIDIVLPHWNPVGADGAARLDAYARRLSALPGVQGLRTVTGTYLDGAPTGPLCNSSTPAAPSSPCAGLKRFTLETGTWLAISATPRPYSAEGLGLHHSVRAQPAPAPIIIGGATAEFLDTRTVVLQRLPGALAIVAALTLALLFAFTRSLFLPLKALVINLLSLTATFGAMVFVFQQGNLRWLVGDFTVTGTTDLMLPFVAFFLAFGLSMDYEILLLARISEAHIRTRDTTRATAEGLQAAAPLFTASAAVVLVVLSALAVTEVTNMKILAVTVALSVLLDAAVIRPLLVPAVMQLAGTANWWLPAPWQRRLRPHPHPASTRSSTTPATSIDTPVSS